MRTNCGTPPNNMDIVYFGNEFPKGDLESLFRSLQIHGKGSDHPVLGRFIQETTKVIKEEVRRLPEELKRTFPPFDSILNWAEQTELRNGPMCGAVEGVLLIVAQLASYIGYIESHPEALQDFPNVALTGLGVGLLSAAAVSLSPTPAILQTAGVESARLAFRMGIHVMGISEDLEAREASPATWAYVVHNIEPAEAQNELNTMQLSEYIPAPAKIFISAVSRTSVTVSGPPSRLRSLFNKSEYFRKSKSIALPVYGGLCHAPHVYGAHDTAAILRGMGQVFGKMSVMPVYSTGTGEPFSAGNASDGFESVITELLTGTIRWDEVVSGVVDRCTGSKNIRLNCFGNSVALLDMEKAMTSNGNVTTINLMSWLSGDEDPGNKPHGPAQSKLAIVGMACRLPGGATDTEKFWQVLEDGLDVSRIIPADRFDISTHYDPTGTEMNKSMTQYGCFIDEPGLFDAPFFNMSPREAQTVDPQMRLALVTAYEALERAGYVANRTSSSCSERIGTYFGQAADDYREVNQGQEVSTYYIPGGCRAFGPGRMNYFFKFAGPSYSIDTACSSGLAAIEVACKALWNGDIDMAVAGGVNILTNPDGFAGLANGHFLTKGHNACKTWDETADGYCRADGVGSVVIKRLEDAQADNDNILAVVLSAGTNHSAEAVSITHPHAGHQSHLARQMLSKAGVDPVDVSYVELHGTGTQAGDFEEMKGILDVYAPKRRGKTNPLHIGAVKSNIGHGESVAGTAALLKVLLMLQKNTIPKHVGIKTRLNPRLPLEGCNVQIPLENKAWPPREDGKRRRLAINNFGAAGGNTTMILEEAPIRTTNDQDARGTHVVAISAKTKLSLTANIQQLVEYLEKGETSIADLAYTTTARRHQFSHRVAVVAADTLSLIGKLRSRLDKDVSTSPTSRSSGPPQIAFTFTGQGASHKSMNLELYRDVPTFRATIDRLDYLAQSQGFPSFVPALDGSHEKDYEHAPVVTQLALVCTEIALARYWQSLGVKPSAVVGHSLGEYAAMHIAGVVSASDTIFMVGRRAQLLQARCQRGSHTMLAVRASLQEIEETALGMSFTIACVNGPTDTVLSGTTAEMESVAVPLQAAGYRCIKLDVAFAFHSEQTDPILDDFEAAARSVRFQEPTIPLVSPLLGKVIFDGKTLNASYVRHATREAVDFYSAVENAAQIGTISDQTLWVEIGPHAVCTAFVKSTLPTVALAVPSLRRDQSNWKTITEAVAALYLAGIDIAWNEFHRPMESRLTLLDLPTYAFNDKNYWLPYKGTWALTKGNSFYCTETSAVPKALPTSEIQTSVVHQVLEESIDSITGTGVVRIQSDLMNSDFYAAANGHRMNNCGVVTSSIHADICYTVAGYLYRKFHPSSKDVAMSINDLSVTKGLVAQTDRKVPQMIQITATTRNIESGLVSMQWQNVDKNGTAQEEPFATATVVYGDRSQWLTSWSPITHLVQGRIEALEALTAQGKANKLSRNMAYSLFARNLVDYDDKYRGMQSVVIVGLEAFADIELTTESHGTWTVPPYFIDSVAHLAGFVMNCSDSEFIDTQKNYAVTPGWAAMRFAVPLVAGQRYRSYVKMIPTTEDPTVFLGDVYIMQDGAIVGMVAGIQFRSFPRILLNHFFSPPDQGSVHKSQASLPASAPVVKTKAPAAVAAPGSTSDSMSKAQLAWNPEDPLPMVLPTAMPGPVKAIAASVPAQVKAAVEEPIALPASSGMSAKALQLIASESGLELSELEEHMGFSDLGVDSLLSLVLSEKFRTQLNVNVSGSLFLDYPTIGDLTRWLDEYYT